MGQEAPQQVGSLSELDAPAPAPVETPTEIVGGDGTVKLPDLKEAQQKQAAEEEEAKKNGGTPPDATTEDEPEEPENPEEPTDEDEPADDFFAAVDNLYGEDINSQIDFEGVDPTTPEGVFKREQFLMDKARRDMDEFLRQTDPRGYAYLLHRKNGGTDEDFMASGASFGLPALEQLQDSVDLQKSIYTRALKERGNSDRQVQTLVEAAIKGGFLAEEAEAAYQYLDETEKAYLDSLDKEVKQSQQRFLDDVDNFNNTLTETVKTMALKIPEAKQKGFLDNFSDKVKYEGGKFFLVEELDAKSLAKILDREYFGYVNGDLTKLVEKRADTKNAQRLKLKADKATNRSMPPQRDDNGSEGFVPLGSL